MTTRAKKIAAYVEKRMGPHNNIGISLGELPPKTLEYLRKKFNVQKVGVLGYWHFTRKGMS